MTDIPLLKISLDFSSIPTILEMALNHQSSDATAAIGEMRAAIEHL